MQLVCLIAEPGRMHLKSQSGTQWRWQGTWSGLCSKWWRVYGHRCYSTWCRREIMECIYYDTVRAHQFVHTHMNACTYAHTHTHGHMDAHTYAHTQAHTHARIHTHYCLQRVHIRMCVYTYIRTVHMCILLDIYCALNHILRAVAQTLLDHTLLYYIRTANSHLLHQWEVLQSKGRIGNVGQRCKGPLTVGPSSS